MRDSSVLDILKLAFHACLAIGLSAAFLFGAIFVVTWAIRTSQNLLR
jgi:hypothetical protein